MIQEKRIVQHFVRLVDIDAPSLAERELADFVKEQLSQMGFQVSEDDAGRAIGGNCGNVYARWPGTLDLEPLLFSGHFDTVEPGRGKKAVVHDDGRITSAGDTVLGADNLACLAAIIEAIRSITEDGRPHRPVELFISVAEERHLLGAGQYQPDRLSARQCYVLDASGAPGLAVVRAPGVIELLFEIQGRSAHAGMEPEKGINAITTAARGIAAMKLGRIDPETTANIGRIEGGGATNVVSAACKVTAECRSQDEAKLTAHADHMCACMQQAADESGALLKIRRQLSYLPYAVSPESPVLRRFRQACQVLDLPKREQPAGGGSDNNLLVRHGIDGIVLSCGMDQVHTCQEQILVKDLVDTARLVEQLILLP
ncbi:MAG: M20/M25/M40 family metallo-hydrolase [Ruminococcaceae bacterium]|nr:M20/M25/M40 family metallo-hydrolase [Oscillospiraceae bacterium]